MIEADIYPQILQHLAEGKRLSIVAAVGAAKREVRVDHFSDLQNSACGEADPARIQAYDDLINSIGTEQFVLQRVHDALEAGHKALAEELQYWPNT